MASKMCVSVSMLLLLVLSCLVVVCKETAAANYEVIMDENGEELRYGQDHTFILISNEGVDKVRFASGPFYFGLGYGGVPVRTDTQVTMVLMRNNGELMACKNGRVEWVSEEEATVTPQEALIRVRLLDATQNLYSLEITDTPGVFLTDPLLHSCVAGQQPTPFNFRNQAAIAHVAEAQA